MSLLLDIANYLSYNNLGNASGNNINIFCDTMQDSPDDCISINEYQGIPSFTSDVIQRSIKILFRANKYIDAKSKSDKVFDLFENFEDRILWLNTKRWIIATARNYPYKIGNDDKERVLFVLNIGMTTYKD